MRLFIAYNFKENVKSYLSEIQTIVKTNALTGNYTLYDNFHITLKFLGEYGQSDVEKFSDILDEFVETEKSFFIKIGDINSFNRKDKHLVYVDVIQNRDKLINFGNNLNRLVDSYYDIKDTNKFKPHITIAREVVFRNVSSLINVEPFNEDISIDKISLMLSSRNKHNILTYTPLYSVNVK